jgi:hypothetical protein
MFRAFLFGVLLTIVTALVGGYFVLRNGVIPANADGTPGWIETWAAGTSLDARLRREAQGFLSYSFSVKFIGEPPRQQ